MKSLVSLGIMVWAAVSGALEAPEITQTPSDHYHAIGFGPLWNLPFLGSQDERAGFVISYQATRPEKRLTLWNRPLKLSLETHLSYTYGGGWRLQARDQYLALGALAMARYENIGPSRRGFYLEVGWGLHYATRRTWDLNTLLNSSPTAGFGLLFPYRRNSVGSIGIRVMHISNAGTVGSNQGQNQAMLFTTFRL